MLKYLFEVTYQDGSTFNQNLEDVSATDPKRSAFFDVELDQVKTFSLVGDGHTYLVDLEDGHFEIDETPIWLHDQKLELENFRLIFWRKHEHTWPEGAHTICYQFGWQANHPDGENIQRVLEIN